MKKLIVLSALMILAVSASYAQPSKKYLMSFFTCQTCSQIDSHRVQLAESNNGYKWTTVPGFTSFVGGGSVPDVVTRGNKLYLYTTQGVKKYNYTSNTWDTSIGKVTLYDSSGNYYSYVDPSLIVDSSGNLVMFFLDATGSAGSDPAGCNGASSCTKYFRSAVEVSGSDGGTFIVRSGARLSYSITSSSGTASDPDIFVDNSKYYLYISTGSNVRAYTSSSLHGTYTAISTLSSGLLTNSGGVPSGYYDVDSPSYWTFIHNSSGKIQIKKHAGYSSSISGFTTVVDYNTVGLGSSYYAESPGVAKNTLSSGALPVSLINFTGVSDDGLLTLKWQTASEKDVSGFEIQYSYDGEDFEKLEFVEAAGNSNRLENYIYSDKMNREINGAYFRLRMVDLNGRFEYSHTIYIRFMKSGFNISVSQNPFSDHLQMSLESEGAESLEITVTDMAGKIMLHDRKEMQAGLSALNYNEASAWPAGIYIVSVKGDQTSFVSKAFHY